MNCVSRIFPPFMAVCFLLVLIKNKIFDVLSSFFFFLFFYFFLIHISTVLGR